MRNEQSYANNHRVSWMLGFVRRIELYGWVDVPMKMTQGQYEFMLSCRKEVMNDPVALEVCDIFIRNAQIEKPMPHFIELSQPKDNDLVFLPREIDTTELREAVEAMGEKK